MNFSVQTTQTHRMLMLSSKYSADGHPCMQTILRVRAIEERALLKVRTQQQAEGPRAMVGDH